MQHSVHRRQSWKGSKESLVPTRHISPLSDSVVYGASEIQSTQTDMGRPLSGSGLPSFAQALPVNGQRVNPPPPPQVRSVTPPPQPPPRGTAQSPQSWEPNSQTKRYSANMDFVISRISPVPPGGWQEGYPPPNMNSAQIMNSQSQTQRSINPVPVGRQPIIMQTSSNSKFGYSGRPGMQNGNGQSEFLTHQGNNNVGRNQPPPYPMSNGPNSTTLQMQGSNGPMSPSAYNNGNLPSSMLVPNRNSHNLELYNLGIPGHPTSWPQSSTQSPQGNHEMPSWQNNIPVRSNSFNNPMGVRQVHPANTQPSATTVTAITPAPIQQPVKSMRVLKPELQTALAPAHPSWMTQSAQPGHYSDVAAHSNPLLPQPEAPNYQGPPPPYPKHLLQQNATGYEAGLKSGKDDPPGSPSIQEEGDKNIDTTVETTEKDKKLITTSPVPVRKNKRDEERRESRIQIYSSQAFKFFMEQHVENILKSHHQRLHRKKQLENEMCRVRMQLFLYPYVLCESNLKGYSHSIIIWHIAWIRLSIINPWGSTSEISDDQENEESLLYFSCQLCRGLQDSPK